MKKKNWLEREFDRQGHVGHMFPYTMVIVGLVFIFITPINVDKYNYYEGRILKYNYTETSLYIYIDVDSIKPTKVQVGVKKYRKLLEPTLPNANYAKVWINKKFSDLRQIEVDGHMVIPYSWWIHTRIFWCFVVIGLILIPFAEKSYRKWRRTE